VPQVACHLVGRYDDDARYARLGADAAEQLGESQWIALLALAVALAEGKVGRARGARRAVARLEDMSGSVAHLRVINDAGGHRRSSVRPMGTSKVRVR
jgi:hypothetical protein